MLPINSAKNSSIQVSENRVQHQVNDREIKPTCDVDVEKGSVRSGAGMCVRWRAAWKSHRLEFPSQCKCLILCAKLSTGPDSRAPVRRPLQPFMKRSRQDTIKRGL